jgi:hypothetical protein
MCCRGPDEGAPGQGAVGEVVEVGSDVPTCGQGTK